MADFPKVLSIFPTVLIQENKMSYWRTHMFLFLAIVALRILTSNPG
jgi:hypothetical protein